MRHARFLIRSIVALLLLGVLMLALVVVINTFIPRQQMVPPPVVQTISPYSPPVYLTAQPTSEGTQINPDYPPTAVSYPTFTPFPSPTLEPGPSPTPIPLITPAKDSSGVVQYIAYDTKNAVVALRTINTDKNGKITNAPSILSGDKITFGEIFVSPDGKYVVIMGAWGIGELLDVNSGKINELTISSILFFNWFPDSRRIMYRNEVENLELTDPFTQESIVLAVPGLGEVDGAAASPDGQYVIYSVNKGSNSKSEIWMVKANGRDARIITELPGNSGVNFSWSPDGKKIAFFWGGWMIMDADGSNLHPVGDGLGIPQCLLVPPSWSPDSSTLAVVDVTEDPSSFCFGATDSRIFKGTNIFLIDIASGKSHALLPDNSTGNIDPTWSPDGSHIAFVSNRDGSPEVWSVNVDGTGLSQITHDMSYVRYPFWRKD